MNCMYELLNDMTSLYFTLSFLMWHILECCLVLREKLYQTYPIMDQANFYV